MISKVISFIKNEFEKRNYIDAFIIAKIAGNDKSLIQLALQAQNAGADAITILLLLRATSYYTGLVSQQSIKIGTPLLGNIHGTVYGAGLGPLTRQLIINLRENIHIPLIASGGA